MTTEHTIEKDAPEQQLIRQLHDLADRMCQRKPVAPREVRGVADRLARITANRVLPPEEDEA